MTKSRLWPALEERVAQLRDGTLTVDAFSEWFFVECDWEYDAPSDRAFRTGLRVENILYQWQDFPDLITAKDVADYIEQGMKDAA